MLGFGCHHRQNLPLGGVGFQHRLLLQALLGEQTEVRLAGLPHHEALHRPTRRAEMIKGHLDKSGRRQAVATEERGRRMDGEGRGVVIGMASFVGVRDETMQPPLAAQQRKPPRDLGQMQGGVLVGEAEAQEGFVRDAGKRHGGAQLIAARGGIGGGVRKSVPLGGAAAARSAISHVDQGDARQAAELPAEADRLVVGMRDNDGDALGRNRTVAGERPQESVCRLGCRDRLTEHYSPFPPLAATERGVGRSAW